MIYIHKLNTGREIIIDEEDKFILDKFHLNTMQTKHGYTRYVVCKEIGTNKYLGLLHRLILNAPKEVIVDHENGNGLDCRKDNLRICNYSENQQNRRLTVIENEVKGLFYRKDRGYWQARITINDKVICLGSYIRKDDAIKARLEAEKIYFNEKFNGLGTMTEVVGCEY